MNKSVYIITTDAYSGKSLVSLGIMQMVMRNTANVGYFKPIVESNKQNDKHIDTMLTHFNLDIDYRDTFAFTRSEVVSLKNQGKIDEVYDAIIKKYKALEERYDFVLVDGTDLLGDNNMFDVSFNTSLAQSLNIPAIVVLKDSFSSEEELINHIQIQVNSIREQEVNVLAVFVNKALYCRNSTKITRTIWRNPLHNNTS